jgi:hypothetical protein
VNDIKLHRQIVRLVELIGVKNTSDFLARLITRMEAWPWRKERIKDFKTLVIAHEEELDGG